MKKVMHGKLYDTDTARECGVFTNSARSQFDFYKETLYEKKTGEFFLHGFGHAASRYAENIDGNARGPGEMILPMSFDQAQVWAEEHLSADEYQHMFGDIQEDEATEVMFFKIPVLAADKLRRKAKDRNQSATDVVVEFIKTL